MSERIVNDPSQHGWIEVDGKWVWDASGGGAGAGMVISETEPTDKVEGMQWLNPTTGLVLFWDDEKWLQMPTTGAAGKDGVDGVDGLWTDNGDTSISYNAGNVGIGTDTPLRKLHISEDSGSAFLQVTTKDDSSSGGVLMGSSSNPTVGQVFYDHYSDSMRLVTSNKERMIIDANGRVDITGSLYVNGTPKIGTVDLIKAFSKLRDAVKDEETVESLKESITNCIGGLIEEWEAMQSPATQEIEQ